ncbi:hypothetical protein [Helicobacter suis]|uniref:hypothetical protein n=1 Tax=Helicobacter suis TaxID=104628 RepID=UPI001F07F42B|nr:hypothetical protein [Helicobacter suis]
MYVKNSVAYLCVVLVGLVLILGGCSDHKKKKEAAQQKVEKQTPPTFHFLDQQHQEMQFKINDSILEIKPSKAMPTLIMVLDLSSQMSPYTLLLEHLQSHFKQVRFLAILNKAYPQDQLDSYVAKLGLHFPLLNPMQSTSFSARFSWPLPYFLLYNAKGQLLQNYHGAIVEEMLSKDLQDLLDTEEK